MNEKEANSFNEPETTLNNKHAKEAFEKKQKELQERNESKEAARKIDADPDLRYTHPLMNCEMNLMEISNRVVERIEKAKYRIVAKSIGKEGFEADKKEFSEMLLKELIKFN